MTETHYSLEYYLDDNGPGYRVYYAMSGKTVVLLLVGGDKSTQQRDIETAKAYWKRQKEE